MLRKLYHRKNDFEKPDSQDKPLTKDESLFTPARDKPQYGGISSKGPQIKKSKSGNKKVYYVAPHRVEEYFALEVLNKMRFNTQKARMIPKTWYLDENNKKDPYTWDIEMAIKEIDGYIPIAAFIETTDKHHQQFLNSHPSLKKIKQKYTLDIEKQVIIETDTLKEFKISGNLFAADIGAKILADPDFQPELANVGLVKVGNRFVTYLIDKEKIDFSSNISFEEKVKKTDERVLKSDIFRKGTEDQRLYIISQLQESHEKHEFEKIFSIERVKKTDQLIKMQYTESKLKEYTSNFTRTVEEAIAFYTSTDPKEASGILSDFRNREEKRSELADYIIERLDIFTENDKEDMVALKEIIMEDLRAPYYSKQFIEYCTAQPNSQKDTDFKNKLVGDYREEMQPFVSSYMIEKIHAFLEVEHGRLVTRGSIDKAMRIAEIINSIDKFNETTKSPEQQKKMIVNTIKYLDTIMHHSEKIPFMTATSEKNWLAFKKNNQGRLALIDPNMNISNALKDVRSLTYEDYKKKFGIFADSNKSIIIDLENDKALAQPKNYINTIDPRKRK